VVAQRVGLLRQRGYVGFAERLKACAVAGVLTLPENPREQRALTELCWIASERWPINLELRGQAFDADGIKEGITTMRHIFRPCLRL